MLIQARRLLARLAVDHVQAGDACREGGEVCSGFGRVLTDIRRTTRSYLHLVHVVMAAEAVEFLRRSEQMRQAALARVMQLQRSIRSRQQAFQWWNGLVSIATVLLGIVACAVIGRHVVRPLEAVTETLVRLTRGDSVAVAGLSRTDEIGEMAAAAQKLQERNALTEKLLAETAAMAQQRETMIVELRSANRDLDNFVHVASHDLKAPLRAIGMLVRWLEEETDLPDEARENLQRVRERTARMTALLRSLHTFAVCTKAEGVIEEVYLRRQIEDAVEMVATEQHEAVIDCDDSLTLLTVPIALTQVLGNLVSNAVRHHDGERCRLNITVRATTADRQGVQIVVTDDGPGVAAEYQQRIFEPFETLAPRCDSENTGMGLAIIVKLVERYGASIRLESPVCDGRGARFIVDWPAFSATRAAADEASKRVPPLLAATP
ncbi:MAG: ATP-binding protein [Planctomycetota bacterium]